MSGAQLSVAARSTALRAVGETANTPLWKRSFAIDGLLLSRFASLLLAAGALLAWTPIHPGLLCPMRATTGVPCPTCGMTTSVKACLNLDFAAAISASPAGIGALVFAAGLVVVRPKRLVVPWVLLVAVLAFMWVWQLFRFSVL